MMDTLQSYLTAQYVDEPRVSYFARVCQTGSGSGTAYSATVSECLAKLRRTDFLNWYDRIEIRDYQTEEILYTYHRASGEHFDLKDFREGDATLSEECE